MNGISRRRLLKRLAAGGATMAVLPIAFNVNGAFRSFDPLPSRLARIFSSAASAERIGGRYLALRPDRTDISTIVAELAPTAVGYLRLSTAGPRRLRALLAQQQREDFAAGRIANVDGWMLSLTEVRLCAIAALAKPNAG